jgi:hypothetical protein
MTRGRYGLIAGIAGAALAAWWWRSRQSRDFVTPSELKGEVIFRNSPIPSSEGIL